MSAVLSMCVNQIKELNAKLDRLESRYQKEREEINKKLSREMTRFIDYVKKDRNRKFSDHKDHPNSQKKHVKVHTTKINDPERLKVCVNVNLDCELVSFLKKPTI